MALLELEHFPEPELLAVAESVLGSAARQLAVQLVVQLAGQLAVLLASLGCIRNPRQGTASPQRISTSATVSTVWSSS